MPALLLVAPALLGCGASHVDFEYPGEIMQFGGDGVEPPRVFAGIIRDLRPPLEREGAGHFHTITYPSDGTWSRPVTDIYGDAHIQDLVQTEIVQVVPLRSQADYVLEVDLLSFSSRIERSTVNMLLPVIAGLAGGVAFGSDSSHGLKVGAVIGVAAFMGVPMPTRHVARAEARLTLTDAEGTVLWQEVCVGELDERIYLTAVDKNFQKLVDEHQVRAVKRCNACLIGQLRQQFVGGLR